MTQLAGRAPAAPERTRTSASGTDHGGTGRGRPRRGIDRTKLPNGRAVLGGFLIAASGVGLFAAYEQAHATPETKFVVSTRALAPGEVIERSDLGLAPAELPPEMTAALTDDWRSLVGQQTTAAVSENQLLSPASVTEPGSVDGPGRRFSLELDRAGALDGNLDSGAVVDVLSSAEGESDATVVATRARVVAVNDDATGDLGQLGSLVITIEVADERALVAVVGASAAGTVTLASPTPGPEALRNGGSGHG